MPILSFIKLTHGSIRSRHLMLTGIVVGVIILLTCFTFFLSVDKEKVLGWTYFGTWWLGKSGEGLTPLDAHIIYTYPDSVQAGKPFDVGVTLEYINDKSARSSWVLFSNVSIILRSLEHPNGPDLLNALNASDHDISSGLLRPGEAYSHSFPIVAPNSREKYLVFLRFTAFFSPEGVGSEPWFYFSANDHYNIGKGKPGYISPNELPPITVVDKGNQTSKAAGELIVEIEKPYGIISPTPINVTIDRAQSSSYSTKQYHLVNGSRTVEIPLASGYHTAIVSHIVNIVPNKIRAVFWRWTDGQGSYNRTVDIASNTATDVFALYKTQYYLSVRSALTGTNTTGSGWYDAGNEAPFAVNQGPNFLLLQSFDHWNWDAPPGTATVNTVTAGSLVMDGPAKITAVWKFDYTYLAIIVGLITGFSAIVTLLWKLHVKIRLHLKKIKS
ncbi:MAG TPA: hypothetical protein VEL11_08990 [Candidatus Bathyarchaeia archaeon]|nr:hypothetical protein [Candidatus Bathyarchaeia archaeon]